MNNTIEIKLPEDSIYFETEQQFIRYWNEIGAGTERQCDPEEYPCIAWRVGIFRGDWKDLEYWAYIYPSNIKPKTN